MALGSALVPLILGQLAVAEPQSVHLMVEPGQARIMAQRALHLGRAELARDIAGQILAQTPQDAEARLILAAAEAQLGRAQVAARQGRLAFGQSKDPDLRFQAAFLTASALAAQDRLAGAKFWLRRADGLAQSPQDSADLRRAFAGLDRRAPLRWSVQFSGGPSDNVNGGSLHDTFWAWGLPIPIAQALPGHAVQGRVKLDWRLSESARHKLMMTAALSTRQVHLSARARALDRSARARDFESLGAEIGVEYRWRASQVQGYGLDVMLGHRWLAQGQSSNSQTIRFSADRALNGGQTLALGLTMTGTQNSYGRTRHALSLGSQAALSFAMGQSLVTGTIGYDAVISDAAGVAWRGPKAAVEWSPPALPGQIRFSVFGELQSKDYWKTTSRPDLVAQIGASARFDALSVMGFAPTVSVTSTRSHSAIVVRDTAETSVTLGVRSKF